MLVWLVLVVIGVMLWLYLLLLAADLRDFWGRP